MKLKELIISDGVIEEYRLNNNNLILKLRDFRDDLFLIKLTNCKKLCEKGSVGFSLSKGVSTKNSWTLYDDDGEVLFVEFESSEIEVK